MFIHTAPRTFVHVPGGWGRLGSRAVAVWEAAEPAAALWAIPIAAADTILKKMRCEAVTQCMW
jgi:hypothetical protein